MSDPLHAPSGGISCWNAIGVWGNGECAELATVGHCRNCTVYVAAGRTLLDRAAPDDYLDHWTTLLEEDHGAAATATVPYVVFRVGQAWFALRSTTVREITIPKVVRRIPHRSSDMLLGVVNVRGEIHPCISLHALLGEQVVQATDGAARFMVAKRDGEEWVLPADEIDGIHRIADADIEPVPTTIAHADAVFTNALFRRAGRHVAVIDEEMLFSAIRRGIA